MRNHLAIAAAIALSLGAAASPARAEDAGTFDAWGHTFDRAPTLTGVAARAVPDAFDAATTASIPEAGRPSHRQSEPSVSRHHGTRSDSLAD